MRDWTCSHCGREFTCLTGRNGLVYHRQRCDGTGNFPPPQPPKEAKPKKRKMGRPKEPPKDPVTAEDRKWIVKNWT